jgi:Zn-dependent protease
MLTYWPYIELGIIFIVSISIHEFAHAFSAYRLWDETPKIEWRLTPNPLSHISLIGFVMIFLINFWWWRPVHINPKNFKNKYRDELVTAFAGPISNIILWILWILILFIYWVLFEVPQNILFNWWDLVSHFWAYFSIINFWLAAFNLIPIVPLDWYRLVKIISPKAWEWMEKYAGLISLAFLAIFIFWPLSNIVWWYITWVSSTLYRFFSFPLMQVFY